MAPEALSRSSFPRAEEAGKELFFFFFFIYTYIYIIYIYIYK